MKLFLSKFTFLLIFYSFSAFSQNSCNKWYFGNYRALDFNTNPPTPLNNSAMNQYEGSASIADASGNLLFYTNGFDIWNASHVLMANGNALTGNQSSSQSALIAKKPGSNNLYYVFTVGDSGIDTLAYSIVDMSLASGSGSVISKNNILAINMTEKLTGTLHCNGTDIWILAHDYNSNNFRSYLLTNAGLNSSPVISSIGSVHTGTPFAYGGSMKISPTGKKIGLGICPPLNAFELYDFDNTTGVVTNSLSLGTTTLFTLAYGVEFSPDGTKFYGKSQYGLYQWNLCNSPPSAFTVDNFNNNGAVTALQLAPNGKIYDMRSGVTGYAISVINNPNSAGAACGYTVGGQPMNVNSGGVGAPNFIDSYLRQSAGPLNFSVSTSCNVSSFTAPTFSIVGCTNSGTYSVTGVSWNFGDPLSGPANTATSLSTSHVYSSAGTYTASLVVYYSCGMGTDTIKQPIVIAQTCLSLTSNFIGCSSGVATINATVGTGPFSYTWLPGQQTGSSVSGIAPGSYSVVVFDGGTNTTYTAGVFLVNNSPLQSVSVTATPSLPCYGAATGTAQLIGPIPGGSIYSAWDNGPPTPLSSTSGLSFGTHTVVVTHPGSGCAVTRYFTITSPSPVVVGVSALSPTACAGNSVTLFAMASGGSPGYSYTWNNGPPTNSFSITQPTGGNYVYTVTAVDVNSCVATTVYNYSFTALPNVFVNTPTICPGITTVLTASGATTYSWSTGSVFAAIAAFPMITTQYTVVGTANTCSSSIVATIQVLPTPTIQIQTNSPVCSGKSLQLSASGGTAYSWYHIQNLSQLSSFTINPVAMSDAGTYQLYMTAANGCTAVASTSVVIYQTPPVSALASTVCVNQILNLFASSPGAISFLWMGPNNFQSILQNNTIINPPISASGIYTLTVTSADGCTNTASAIASVVALPNPNVVSNSPICSGKTLSVNGNGVYWTGPNGYSNSSSGFTITNATPSLSGQYTLLTISGPCTVYTTVNLVVDSVPSVTLIPQYQNCENSPVSLIVNGSGNNYYSWNGPGNQTGTGSVFQITSANLNQTGVYTVNAVNNYSCQASATTTLQILPAPDLTLTGTTEICEGEQTQILANGANFYYWSAGTSNNNSLIISPAFTQTYSVTGTNLPGCSSTKVFTLSVSPCTGLQSGDHPENKINIFPNPGNGKITVSNLTKDDKIELYDITGKILLKMEMSDADNLIELYISDLPGSLYLLIVKDGNGRQIVAEKIIKY